MNRFSKYISSQFKNPSGIGGVIITMIQNVVNQAMYKNAVSMINLQSDENILDIEKVKRGEDKRTTLMIRNIPNG